MAADLPTVTMLIRRINVELLLAVRGFEKKDKFDIGVDLRAQARQTWQLANRAWRDPGRRADWLDQLAWAVDELRFLVEVGSDLKAFASGEQFEAFMKLAANLGKQVGGWKKKHPIAQSPARQGTAAPERGSILSSPDASKEASA